MKKNAKVVMLPTEKASPLWLYPIQNKLSYYEESGKPREGKSPVTQHLYLISGDEIKENDWIIIFTYRYGYTLKRCKSINKNHIICTDNELIPIDINIKKVIASTDPELSCKQSESCNGSLTGKCVCTKDFPTFSEDFLKSYVKANGKIDEVMVEYYVETKTCDNLADLMSTMSTAEYEITTYEINKLKLTDNNEVIIHLEEEKMYSREEVEKLCENAFDNGSFRDIDFDEWIEENL